MGRLIRPRGVVDLRGREPGAPGPGPGLRLGYPPGAVVVVSGVPGSGKSTLLRALSATGTSGANGASITSRAGGPGIRVADPRAAHLRWQARMPARLPYAVYRPLARLHHLARLCAAARSGAPVLVHDCGSRAWLRRLLAYAVRHRTGRAARGGGRTAGVHLVLIDVAAPEALRGQRARGRRAPRRVFAAHVRGVSRLLAAIEAYGGGAAPEVASVVLLDRVTRGWPTGIAFDAAPVTDTANTAGATRTTDTTDTTDTADTAGSGSAP
ncbi:ATP/GTP-binding protein [Streptomyces sp. 8L]|nr:ATP/GTP-binding protein [Streptomyces sp. 8L]